MKIQIICLSLATLLLAACKDSSIDSSNHSKESESAPAEQPSKLSREVPEQVKSSTPAQPKVKSESFPELEDYKANGIPGLPDDVSDKIISEASLSRSQQNQLNIINAQAEAWRYVDDFRNNDTDLPEEVKSEILGFVTQNDSGSLKVMAASLKAHKNAYFKVRDYQLNGAPNASVDDSKSVIHSVINQHRPDYVSALSSIEHHLGIE